MTKQIADYATKVFGAFTVICALIQFFEYNSPFARPIIVIITVICAVGFGVSLIRTRNYNYAFGELDKIADLACPDSAGFHVKLVENVAELRELWELGQKYYGDDDISYDRFKDWWEKYNQGVYILKCDGEIIGEFEIWPLVSTAFKSVLEGRKREREIGPEDIESEPSSLGHQQWYIASALLARKFRRHHCITILLSHAMRLWLQEAASARHIRICALASSKEGEALLRRFGFSRYRKANETLDGWPSYLLETKDVE